MEIEILKAMYPEYNDFWYRWILKNKDSDAFKKFHNVYTLFQKVGK